MVLSSSSTATVCAGPGAAQASAVSTYDHGPCANRTVSSAPRAECRSGRPSRVGTQYTRPRIATGWRAIHTRYSHSSHSAMRLIQLCLANIADEVQRYPIQRIDTNPNFLSSQSSIGIPSYPPTRAIAVPSHQSPPDLRSPRASTRVKPPAGLSRRRTTMRRPAVDRRGQCRSPACVDGGEVGQSGPGWRRHGHGLVGKGRCKRWCAHGAAEVRLHIEGVGACRVAHLVQVSASQVRVVVIALIAAPPEGERCAAARRGKRLATAPADAMVICTRLVDVRWRLARL